MASKYVTVTEQTHERLTAWKAANGNADFDHVIGKALDALDERPQGLDVPEAPQTPATATGTTPPGTE